MKNTMKTIFVVAATSVILWGCSKDEAANMQSHNTNVMMNQLHKMMDTMKATPMPGDPDHHFARMMQLHHKGAINMSLLVIQSGKDSFIRKMAQAMVQNQTEEISQLQDFIVSHTAHGENTTFNMQMEMSMQKMDRSADLQIINGNPDHDFATLIIFHHQSAIEMADLVIHYGHEASVKTIAEKMKTDQENEIKQLQVWLLNNR